MAYPETDEVGGRGKKGSVTEQFPMVAKPRLSEAPRGRVRGELCRRERGRPKKGEVSAVSPWVGAPRDTSAAVIDKLNKEINVGLADPRVDARLADLGGTTLAGTPRDFGKLIADETVKWGKVVRAATIKAD